MPGTVSDVSATFVDSTTRRPECGENTRCCSAAESLAYRGTISVLRRLRSASASAVSRISRSPDRNTKMSPSPSDISSSTAWQVASTGSRSIVVSPASTVRGRYRISTGNVRPDTSMIGAATPSRAKCCANRSGSMVADVMTILRSGRRGSSCARYPRMKSMFRLRSCASSMMRVSYWRSSRSRWISASRMPSVISLTRVESEDWSVNRTL
ncbi:unannotated protein [freshwater metagenome]|uniref:Unannotated protein n=1 Tax=freshwater metagenome TaxID=449393 RepID=A0A6J7ICJ1_9ZZZZ